MVPDKVIRLIDFLVRLTSIRSKIERDISQYECVVWISSLPNDKNCYTRAWGSSAEHDEDEWLEVQSIREPVMPSVPEICKGWVDPDTLQNYSELPNINHKTILEIKNPLWHEGSDEALTIERNVVLDDFPEVKKTWEKYLQEEWKVWSEKHSEWGKVHAVYSNLFSIYQQQLRLGEEYELVLGIGLLNWLTPTNQKIRRHLVIADAQLEFEANLGKFTVRPRSDGTKLRVELDMIEVELQPAGAEKVAMEGLTSATDDPWDKAHVEPVLMSLVHSINSNGEYIDSLQAKTMSSEKPVVEYAPALILRKRSARGLTKALNQIKETVSSGQNIPDGFASLAEIVPSEPTENDAQESRSSDVLDGEIYFPKPSNDEQRRIVHKLKNSRGVLVQGPPGTGKSHTIANLICHFLATGQRILITAKTPRALQVLNAQLPENLRSLCINLLGTGSEERKSLEASVSGILREKEQWQPDSAEQKKTKLEKGLHELRKLKEKLERRLREIRESEIHVNTIAGGKYNGTAAQIAKAVSTDKALYEWFKDQLKHDAELSVETNDLNTALQALRKYSTAKREELLLVRADSVPDSSVFSALVSAEKESVESERLMISKADEQYAEILIKGSSSEVVDLALGLTEFEKRRSQVLDSQYTWTRDAIKDVLSGNVIVLQKLSSSTSACVDLYGQYIAWVDSISLEIPSNLNPDNLQKDAEILRTHLAAGGSLGWGIFRPKVVRDIFHIFDQVKLNGHPCRTTEDFATLSETLKVRSGIEKTWQLWSGRCEKINGPLELQIANLAALRDVVDLLLPLAANHAKCKQMMQVFPGIQEPDWNNAQNVDKIAFSCRLVGIRKKRIQAQSEIQSIALLVEQVLKGKGFHPLNQNMKDAVSERNVSDYKRIFEEFVRLRTEQEELTRLDEWMHYLSTLLPTLAHELKNTANEPFWDDRLKDIGQAWKCAQATYWLQEHIRKEDIPALNKRIKQTEDEIHNTIAELAALFSWKHCFSRLKPSHQSHMEAWRQSMRSLGKGTGKYASRYRREAQEHLDACREAVPAWVMPLHRIWDTIKPQPAIFDVIIIDEASQCGVEGLALMYFAKKVLIVGDDKQISPDAVGIHLNTVHNLRNEFLSDFVFKSSFDVESSLFDHGKLRFGTNRIALKEHFRCMPEIIRFSNELCYSETPLIPLRQYGPDRLPPLKHFFVSGGYREGEGSRVVNRPEAEAIVEKIEEMCADPRFSGKTMGVVILQGDAQAALIEKMLLEKIGAKTIQERRLICGNPYTFQGDERHIILLSMVAAPNARIGPLTSSADERRFNVAASRAQDMMILFHSVKAEDLSQNCLRKRLLEFFCGVKQAELAGLSIGELELRAARDNRQLVRPPQPFDSWFELDVALQLLRRGFSVDSQREVAGKSIDLVVEGGKARLAVECDGDRWHGADNYDADMNRQRQLERCGWAFFRVRESAFYANKEDSLRPLWEALEERGISPVSSQPSASLDQENEDDELTADEDDKSIQHQDVNDRRPEEIPAAEIHNTILAALNKCPNKTCTQHSITSRVLKELGIITRGQPFAEFERRVLRSLGVLEARNRLARYKAKNKRLRLIEPSEILEPKTKKDAVRESDSLFKE